MKKYYEYTNKCSYMFGLGCWLVLMGLIIKAYMISGIFICSLLTIGLVLMVAGVIKTAKIIISNEEANKENSDAVNSETENQAK